MSRCRSIELSFVLAPFEKNRIPPLCLLVCLSRRYRNPVRAKNAGGPRYIGFAEHDAADKYLGKAKAGSAGVYVMRIPISKSGERGVNGYFETKMGAESPGPASHFPSVSSISPRGCPVFGTPKAMDLRDWERQENSEAPDVVIPPRPAKTAQVHRRWPFSSPPIQLNNGRVPGSPGMDSPGPCTVNIANHDPFRPKSFLKTGICRPPSAHPTEKKGHRLPWKENVYLRRAWGRYWSMWKCLFLQWVLFQFRFSRIWIPTCQPRMLFLILLLPIRHRNGLAVGPFCTTREHYLNWLPETRLWHDEQHYVEANPWLERWL